MSLLTYKDARPWARSIKEKVINRDMPPWHLDKTVGIKHYKNDRSLSDSEISTIVRWVDGGAPKGNEADLPPLPDDLLTDEAMSARAYHPRRHLLKGLIWLFIGLGLLAALYAAVDAKTALFALVPAGIGLAHLIYYFVEGKNIPAPENQSQPNPATRP